MRSRRVLLVVLLASLGCVALSQGALSAAEHTAVAAPELGLVAATGPKPVSPHPGADGARRGRPNLRRGHHAAVVEGTVSLHNRPGGPVTERLPATTEFGSRRVLGVAASRRGWLAVVSTTRPNGSVAWVRKDDRALRVRRVGYSLHADLSGRWLELRRFGHRVRRFSVAVGRPGSSTPTGRFVVTDKMAGSRFGPYYGCCILALSGHQPNTPPGWTGGDRLAIHGTDSPGTIGQAASAGCLRAADADLRSLMRRVPLGTPVFIHA
jgi:L,D-transpeptidase catalytic domain